MHSTAWMLTISGATLLAVCGFVIRFLRHRGFQTSHSRVRAR